MSQRIIEVELRGPVEGPVDLKGNSRKRVDQILEEEKAILLGEENRFLIDYSTKDRNRKDRNRDEGFEERELVEGFEDRELDVRIRSTNRQAQIVVKRGPMALEAREEAAVDLKPGQLGTGLRLLALLGYRKGVACERRIVRYECKRIEFAIQDALIYDNPAEKHSSFFEAEIKATEKEKDSAVEELRAWLAKHGLSTYSGEEWNSYVKELNRVVNGQFVFGESDVGAITKRHDHSNEEPLRSNSGD